MRGRRLAAILACLVQLALVAAAVVLTGWRTAADPEPAPWWPLFLLAFSGAILVAAALMFALATRAGSYVLIALVGLVVLAALLSSMRMLLQGALPGAGEVSSGVAALALAMSPAGLAAYLGWHVEAQEGS